MTKPNLIFFSGKLGSGKTEISKRVAQRLSLRWNGFGYTLKRIATERGISISRPNLQELGESLVANDLELFCKRVIDEATGGKNSEIVIDGLRHIAVREHAKTIHADNNVFCIFVEVDENIRQSRIFSRDGISQKELQQLEDHQTERDVADRLRKEANFVADNSRNPDFTVTAVINWLNQLT